MALLAILLDERCDVLGERHRPGGRPNLRPGDGTPLHWRLLDGDFASGENIFNRFLQIAARRRFSRSAETVLVVDTAPITQMVLAVEHDHRRRMRDAQGPDAGAVEVFDEGEFGRVPNRLSRRLDNRIVRTDVDCEQLDALGAVVLVELYKRGQVALGQRATGGDKGEHEGLLVVKIVERTRQVTDILERYLADLVADLHSRGLCRDWLGTSTDHQGEGDQQRRTGTTHSYSPSTGRNAVGLARDCLTASAG